MSDFNLRLKEWVEKNRIPKGEVAKTGGITPTSLSAFFRQETTMKSTVIEKLAEKWPEMICYAFDLPCVDDSQDERIRKIVQDEIERLNSDESKKNHSK
ncbi:MAG: helix-turn-helix domain-containing protein [Hydrogenovibrio sp.]